MAIDIPSLILNKFNFDLIWSIGEKIITIILILLLTWALARSSKKIINNIITKSKKLAKVDKTQLKFVSHFLSGLIYFVGFIIAAYTIPQFRAFSVSLFAGAGVIAIIIGFASQQAVSNIISGVFIAMFEPIRVGDWVKLQQGTIGIIEDINLRHTVIRTFKNKRVVIPNTVMNNEIIQNSHLGDEKIRQFINIDISYDSDIDRALKIMEQEAKKHPNQIDNRTQSLKDKGIAEVVTRVVRMNDSGITVRAYAWAKSPLEAFQLKCDLLKSIKKRFDAEGIEIPFPHRTIAYKEDILKERRKAAKKISRRKK